MTFNSSPSFDTNTINALGTYVYILVDPRSGKIFYIGKGNGNRVFQHALEAVGSDSETEKLSTIREILDKGLQVQYYILRHGMEDSTAFEVECAVIDLLSDARLKHSNYTDLKNVSSGHDSFEKGLMSIDEVKLRYEAAPLDEITDPVVILNVNSLKREQLNEKDIYERTRGSWVMSESKVQSVKYALADYRGLILEVYEILRWEAIDSISSTGKSKKRYRFEGRIAPEHVRIKYRLKTIANSKVQGAANPVRYKI